MNTYFKNYLLTYLVCVFSSLTHFIYSNETSYEDYIDKKYCLVLEQSTNSGMFAVFGTVLGALNLYDQGHFAGIKINLKEGIYLDPERGPNWWEYYFEPIHLGDERLPKYYSTQKDATSFAFQGLPLAPKRAFELIRKYIHLKFNIRQKVEKYAFQNFNQYFVIGVHHRGTDKITEWPLVSYEKTYQFLNQLINNLSSSDRDRLRIYVATDDQNFLDYLINLMPSLVIYNDFVRSADETPLHYGDKYFSSNYTKGEEAVIDCLLLSKCNILVRPGSSCLSLVSSFFNPRMPVYSLWEKKK